MKYPVMIQGKNYFRVVYNKGEKRVIKTPERYGEYVIGDENHLEVELNATLGYELVNKAFIN